MELNEGATKAAAATAKQNFFREETKVEGRKRGATERADERECDLLIKHSGEVPPGLDDDDDDDEEEEEGAGGRRPIWSSGFGRQRKNDRGQFRCRDSRSTQDRC